MATNRQIHIAIDGNEANLKNRVGSNVYAFEILNSLHSLLKKNSNVSVTVLLSQQPIRDLPSVTKRWQYRVIKPSKFWTQWALPIHLFLSRNKYQLFFTPGHYAPRISSLPYVSSVMDLAFLKYPKQFKTNDLIQLSDWTKYSVKKAKKVVAISQHTKQDIIQEYGKKPNDIVIAPPAVNPPASIPSSKQAVFTLKKLGIKKPYFVHVGTIQPRKNIVRLVSAFEQLSRKIQSHQVKKKSRRTKKTSLDQIQLVLVGKVGWLAQPIMDRIERSPFSKNIIITGYVSDKTKLMLLKQSQGTVQAGLYEGFGIPALEAMQIGTIPIVSDITSLPEVVGKAGFLVNPLDSSSIANAMFNLLIMTAKTKAQRRRVGRQQANKFSWDNSGSVILETLLQVAREHSK
jgi:glycosyltransferase involved in cell wall biosynthesis